MAGQPQIPASRKAEAVRLRALGKPWPEVAVGAGVSVPTARRAVAEAEGRTPQPARGTALTPTAPAPAQPPQRRPTGIDDATLVQLLREELAWAIEERRMGETTADRVRASKLAADIIRQLNQLQPDPAPTREELEAKLRPQANDVLGKVRNGLVAVAQREAETGRCLRCGHDLPPELILRRRVEAGMADPPPVH